MSRDGRVPNHIKFIYIMILKYGCSAEEILRRSVLSYEVAADIAGHWEGGMYAEALEKQARNFIREYGILDELRLRKILSIKKSLINKAGIEIVQYDD